MYRHIRTTLILCFLFLRWNADCQQINAIRSLDNNKLLSEDTTDWKIHRIIKNITFGNVKATPSVSFGGEFRQQLRSYQNMSFGDVKSGSKDHDIYILQRYLVHTDLRITNNLRFFVQLNSNFVNGKDNVSVGTDHDDFGVMQAFADLQLNKPLHIQLRVGRQEFSFGSERIMGMRDGPNIRQTYEGARVTIGLKKATGDFLIVQPVSYKPGFWDNKRDKSILVYSSYWTIPLAGKKMLDIYYFGNKIENLKFMGDTASENRQTGGFRFSSNANSLYYDAEVIYQFGKFGTNRISAWQVSSIIGYRWKELAFKPRVQFREGILSGDKIVGDGIINTFRPISARPPVNDLLPAGPANIIVIAPEGEISVHGVAFVLRYMAMWRFSGADGMYSGDVRTMTRKADETDQSLGKSIATGIVSEINYSANKHISLSLIAAHFFAGDYIINTGKGEDNSACTFRVTYKF